MDIAQQSPVQSGEQFPPKLGIFTIEYAQEFFERLTYYRVTHQDSKPMEVFNLMNR